MANRAKVEVVAEVTKYNSGMSEVTGGLDKLAHKLREHRAEEVQQQRGAKFFTEALKEMGVAATGTAGMLGQLVSGFAFGGGVGLAVEALKVSIHLLGETSKEANKEIAKGFTETYKVADEIGKEWDQLLDGLDKKEATYVANHVARMAQKKLADRETTGGLSLADIEAELRKEEAIALKRVGPEGIAQGYHTARSIELKKQISQLRNQLDIIRALEQESGKKANEARAPEQVAQDDKAAAERRKSRAVLEEQFRQKDIAATKWVEDEKARLKAEAQKRGDAIISQMDADETKRREGDIERESKFMLWVEETRVEGEKAAQEEVEAMQRHQAQQWISLGTTISNSFARGFTNALFHASSFEEGIKSVFDGILAAFEQLIEQMVAKLMASIVLKYLGLAIGGPVGGFVAEQAGGSLFGGDPGGGDLGGLGVRSNGLTVNVSAIDAQGVRQFVESDHFRRAVREAQRNGRG